MTKDDLKILDLPDTPGVYFFLGIRKEILYIGKATSLRNRVRSYFSHTIHETRSPLIEKMVTEAATVEVTSTESVLEALILETNLIRSHKPTFNTKSKDDKSYNHLIITKEEWPRLLVVRGRDLHETFSASDISYHIGPFPNGALLRDALKIIRKLFRYYDTSRPVGTETTKLAKGKIDFNRQIGLYPGTTNKIEYKETIRHLKLFFQGKKRQIIKELEQKMLTYAREEEFEQAALCKKKLFALQHIDDIALLKTEPNQQSEEYGIRIEAYDVAHHGGKDMVGVMTVVQSGNSRSSEYRKFIIKSVTQANDPAALREVLRRRLEHTEWRYPDIIVVDGNEVQVNAAKGVLSETNLLIPVVAVVKDERHKPSYLLGESSLLRKHRLEILLANAESHRFALNYYRQKSRKSALR